jgi:hypothetical protein
VKVAILSLGHAQDGIAVVMMTALICFSEKVVFYWQRNVFVIMVFVNSSQIQGT